MNAKDIFLNSYARMRSGWRFVIFLIAFIFLSIPGAAILSELWRLIFPSPNSVLVFASPYVLTAAIAILLGWLLGKYLEGLPFRALGFSFTKNWAKDLALGFIIGAASICFAALIDFIFGGVSFEINRTAQTSLILQSLGGSLLIFIAGAVNEEAIFRGYMQQTLTRSKLALPAVLILSTIFASGHIGNPNATFFSWANTFLAGIWFGVAYLKTRNLWFPFGLHLAWNWFQGAILGINVSGLQELTPAPILVALDKGPVWLTGGSYGIEGGFVCTLTLILSTVLIWFAPFLKPTEEMLRLTDEENPVVS